MQQVARGVIFLTKPSVIQPFGLFFFVSTTCIKQLHGISENLVGIKDIMFRCAYYRKFHTIGNREFQPI